MAMLSEIEKRVVVGEPPGEGPGPFLHLFRCAAEKAAHHGKQVCPGTDKGFAIVHRDTADGGAGQPQGRGLAKDIRVRRWRPGFGGRRKETTERQVIRPLIPGPFSQIQAAVAGGADDEIVAEQAAWRRRSVRGRCFSRYWTSTAPPRRAASTAGSKASSGSSVLSVMA